MCCEQESSPEVMNEMVGEVGLRQRLEAIEEAAFSSPEMTRRTLLRGLGTFIGLTAFQGIGSLVVLSREQGGNAETQALQLDGDACAENDISCYLQEAGLDVPAATTTPPAEAVLTAETVPGPVATTPPPPAPPPTTTAPPPPAPPPPTVHASAMEVVQAPELPTPERRRMPYEEFASNAELMISRLPSLEMMNSLFPGTKFFQKIEEQKQHIRYLDEAVQPDVEECRQFVFDESRIGAFSGNPMAPRMLIWHWTGSHFDSPQALVDFMHRNGLGVHSYIHADGSPHRLSELGVILGHALGQNEFAMGMEVYSGVYDNENSPLFSFDPARTKSGLYSAVRLLRAAGLPVNHATLFSHFSADLIFSNPYYDPYQGTFHEIQGHKPPHIRKFDQPQEFMQMIIPKAMELDAALGPR